VGNRTVQEAKGSCFALRGQPSPAYEGDGKRAGGFVLDARGGVVAYGERSESIDAHRMLAILPR
jgi:hypothetical protein